VHFDFAMGKALEDEADYAASFSITRAATGCAAASLDYVADEMSSFVRESMELFTAEFFASRAGYGAPDSDPIFIVGLPRSGST
jgi:hypothetical protein